MWTSSVFVEPNQFSSQTSDIRSSRVTTRPASRIEPREQVELLARELERRAVERRAAGAGSSRSAVDLDRRVGRRRRVAAAAPQHGADARDHLGRAERLDDVVVGAELEPDDPVGLGPARGEHDDRDAGLAGAARGTTSRPSPSGSADVEQDEVGSCAVERARAPTARWRR